MSFISPARARLSAVVATAAAGVLVTGGATAAAEPSSSNAGVDVVVSGLDSPRGLNFAPGGVLYITEAGQGGTSPCAPAPGGGERCFGDSGKVTGFADGVTWTVADDLPSVADAAQSEVAGPHDVVHSPHGLIVSIGLGADPAERDALGDEVAAFGTVTRVDSSTGAWTSIADLAEHEGLTDPDAGQPGVDHPDSNPFGLAIKGSTVIAADAGGNSILEFKAKNKKDAKITTRAVLPFQFAEAPPFLGLPPGTQIPMQPVPTSIAVHNGRKFVGQLTGFPFQQGAANVYELTKNGPEVVAGGFTNIIDIAFDASGEMLVLEMFTNGMLSGDPSGALWRIDGEGERTLVADASDGLQAPAGVAVAHDGSYYVTNKGVFGAGQGEVLRIVP